MSKVSKYLLKLFTNKKNNEDNNLLKESPSPILLNYFSSLVIHHPDVILFLTTEGEILSQNKEKINLLLGYSPKEKLDFKKIISKKNYDKLKSGFHQTLLGKSQTHQITIQDQQNHPVYLSLTFIPIQTASGDVDNICLIVQDHTQFYSLIENKKLANQHLHHAQQIANIGSWEYFIQKETLLCSDSFYYLFGIEKIPSIRMKELSKYFHPKDYKKTYDTISESIRNGVDLTTNFRIFHGKTKELRYIKVQAEVIFKDGQPTKLVGVIKDFTEQKQTEDQLISQSECFQHILDHLHVGLWMKEYSGGKITFVSKGMEEILGVSTHDIYNGQAIWEEMVYPEHREEVLDQQKLLAKGQAIKHKYRIICGDGTVKWVEDQTIPKYNAQGEITHLSGMLTDITPEVETKEQLHYLANYDPLTSLPNHKSIRETLIKLCQEENNFALLCIDLDNLQQINHALGYKIGDKVLRYTAKKLQKTLPKNTFIARMSSHTFSIIIKDYTTKRTIFNLAEEITNQFKASFTINDYELYETISIGISFFPEDGASQVALLESAYSALYHAKKRGESNYQIYSSSKDISAYKKYILEQDMRKAIQDNEFELYYQPQVDPYSGIIVGAEALIRWNHEEWGIVSPGEFIPLAEEKHLINDLTDWVIKEVCAHLRKWRNEGYTLRPIAINISPIRLMKKGLIDFVEKQLATYDIPTKYIMFEITESKALEKRKSIRSTLSDLRELGIKVIIDDYGTGFTSIQYLHDYDIDTIKIDKTYVQNIVQEDKKDAAIVSSLIHLAKALDMKVVAEGVEEYEQLEFLKQKECNFIQGYLFSKPVPVQTFEQMMKTGYLHPKSKVKQKPIKERRKFYRLILPHYLPAELSVTEVNQRKVDLGTAPILIENISIGGLKILSTLNLPVHSSMKFRFNFTIMEEYFTLNGHLIWKNEAKGDTFYYGIEFDIVEKEKDRLAGLINHMTALQKQKKEIPNTNFIKESAHLYFKNLLT